MTARMMTTEVESDSIELFVVSIRHGLLSGVYAMLNLSFVKMLKVL